MSMVFLIFFAFFFLAHWGGGCKLWGVRRAFLRPPISNARKKLRSENRLFLPRFQGKVIFFANYCCNGLAECFIFRVPFPLEGKLGM